VVSSFRCNLPCRMWQQYFMDFRRYTRHSEGMFCGSFFPSPLAFLYFSPVFFVLFLYFHCYSFFFFLRSIIILLVVFPAPVSLFLNNMHKIRNTLQLTMGWKCVCNPKSSCRLPKNVPAEIKKVFVILTVTAVYPKMCQQK